MSGGADSSVSAHMLREQGHEVVGFTLRLWSSDASGAAATDEHVHQAEHACRALGISHHVVDCREAFERTILQSFVETYASGLTPSPCVLCNRLIKFGVLLDAARSRGCQALATGHYARRRVEPDGTVSLWRGRDPGKDQSYFLFALTQDQLRAARFPLADRVKTDVRTVARHLGLVPERTEESQDLCFLSGGDYVTLMGRRRPDLAVPGPIVDGGGHVLGRHRGFFRYTVGQRRGLGLGGGPWYVVDVDPGTNRVVVGRRDDAMGCVAHIRDTSWIPEPPAPPVSFRALVQLRYGMEPVPARIETVPPAAATVHLERPVLGIAPGQAAVFYDGDRVLGGGWICRAGSDGPTPGLALQPV